MECVSAKMAVSKSKSPLFNFQLVCFCLLPCAYFFNCCSEAFGVACVPRPEQLVRSTPLLPLWHAEGCQGRAGSCVGCAVGISEYGLSTYTNLLSRV